MSPRGLGGLLAVALVAGCASAAPPRGPQRSFDFARDSLGFSNELYWEYDFDAPPGAPVTHERQTPIEGGHLCVGMARAVRQFFYAARFEPGAPALDAPGYRARVRAVLDTDPRLRQPSASPVVIPGYPDLRSFSRDHRAMIESELGGAWTTYMQRGNWRMIVPFAPRQLRASAQSWLDELARGELPVVRVVNFPTVDVNHTLVIFAAEQTPLELRFRAYDPNDASAPVSFVFERATRTFHYPRTSYFGGGTVKVYEIYHGFFF